MRVLYIDIDSLRADHLGCYGYHRNTSPNIDRIAQQAVRFDNLYITDAPCLPSRTALWSGRFGYRNGVVNHGGTAATPFNEGRSRGFRDVFDATGWMSQLRRAGMHTVTVSSFGERHAAWHWYAGYKEMYNPGSGGMELANEVNGYVLDWLKRNGKKDNWFLHANYWDPHTPYRTPMNYGNPFESDPVASWLTEEVRARQWAGYGPHSAQEPQGYGGETDHLRFPRFVEHLDSMDSVKHWMDGYDTGIRYADDHLGQVFNTLADLGILEETAIIIGADHGENQGELNVWADHQTADQITCRVPLVFRWPGLTDMPRVDQGLHYHFDWAATLIELLGGTVPSNWDGQSFAAALKSGQEISREYLVMSQNAWSCQRGVRFGKYLYLRTYHDGYKQLDPEMLFDLEADPHEQTDLVEVQTAVRDQGRLYLRDWEDRMKLTSTQNVDPMMTVLREGGSFHTRGELPRYIKRLNATGRSQHASYLARKHPDEL